MAARVKDGVVEQSQTKTLVWASGSLDGPTIFAEACARCHGPTGRPTEQLVQQLGVKDLTAPELREKITPALVLHQVKTGSENRIMPSFAGALSAAQMDAVAKYVASPDFMIVK